MIGKLATFMAMLLCGGLLLWIVVSILVWDRRVVFERRLFRFRLRTLLLFMTVVQIAIGLAVWWNQLGVDVAAMFAGLGLAAFLIWMGWWVVDDVLGPTAARRFKSRFRPSTIETPKEPRGVEPPPPPPTTRRP